MKIYDPKTKKKVTIFKEYKISNNVNSCPECKRVFKELDLKWLNVNGKIRCPKCNAKLIRE